MTMHQYIKGELRTMGYAKPHINAIISIAKASRSCAVAGRWWSREMDRIGAIAIHELMVNVRRLAAIYSTHFIPATP